MRVWIARDDSGQLWAYIEKPYKDGGIFMPQVLGDCWQLPYYKYPEVTFENSPIQLVTLIENPQL